MVHTKVTGGKSFGSTGAAILRADLPKGMSKRDFLDLNRRINQGQGTASDQEIVRQVLGNSLLRQSGRTAAEDGFDMRKTPNKKHFAKLKKTRKERLKQEKKDVDSRVKSSLDKRADNLISKMNKVKTVDELEKQFGAAVDRFAGRYPDMSRKANKAFRNKPRSQNAEYNPKTGKLWNQKELDSSPKIRAAIRRQTAQDNARLRKAELIDNAYEKFGDRAAQKVFKAYERLENKLPIGGDD